MTNTPISGLSLGGAIAATDAFAGVEVVGVGPVRKLGEQFQELALDFVAGACLGSGLVADPAFDDGANTLTFSLEDIDEGQLIGRASGAGTGAPVALSPAQARTLIGTITSGAGAPSSTPSFVGQSYIDTTNDVVYIATGTASSADWMLLGAFNAARLPLVVSEHSNKAVTPTAPTNGTIQLIVEADDDVSGRGVFQGWNRHTVITFRRANGTKASPSALTEGDSMGEINGFGYGATGWTTTNRAKVDLLADEDWTDSAQGTRVCVWTTPNGTTTPVEVARFDNAGVLLLGASEKATGTNEKLSVLNAIGTYRYGNDTSPPITYYRKARGTEGSPAAVNSGDLLLNLNTQGHDGTAFRGQASMRSYATENWSGSARGAEITFECTTNGATSRTERAYIQQGLVVGSPTGADKGVGTINATAVYDDNSLLTCYVFDQYLDGEVSLNKWDAKVPDRRIRPQRDEEGNIIRAARTEKRKHDPLRKFAARIGTKYDPLTLDGYAKHWKEKRHLTAMPNEVKFDPEKNMATGKWIQRLIETVETQAILIEQLNQKVKTLEARSNGR